jgi:proline iminopeptidase
MELFPPIEPFKERMIPVSPLHTLHVEEVGTPSSPHALFLHGGPGGGIEPIYRRFFNPEKWHCVLFDQRGCGKSTPFAELRENTTWDCVEDIEKIRGNLGIDSWVVFGGSWGSTLALAYAIAHPERVKGLILRGLFMLRKTELYWFYQEGCSNIFPEAWERFVEPIPEAERCDFLKAYYKRLTSNDPLERNAAARAWSIWEGSTSKLFPDKNLIDHYGEQAFAEAFARIECHYFINGGWMDTDDYFLRNVGKIRRIPSTLVQGRYDMVCPIRSAWDLHRAWPELDLRIIADAGHSISEPGIASALVELTEKYEAFA